MQGADPAADGVAAGHTRRHPRGQLPAAQCIEKHGGRALVDAHVAAAAHLVAVGLQRAFVRQLISLDDVGRIGPRPYAILTLAFQKNIAKTLVICRPFSTLQSTADFHGNRS